MSNPNIEAADLHIAGLIETLSEELTNWSTRSEEKPKIVSQIAELRASMNPVVHQIIHQK